MELNSPTKKKGRYNPNNPPFPILNDDIHHPDVFTGYFNGFAVVINGAEEISALHNMGFFGKGSLSRGGAKFGKIKKGFPPVLSETQWVRRKEWIHKLNSFFKNLPGPSNNGKQYTRLESNDNPESLKEDKNTENKSEKLDITPMDKDVQITEESIVSQKTDTDKPKEDLNEHSDNEKESTKHESEQNLESLEIIEPRNTENKSEKLDITPMDEEVQIIEEIDTDKCEKDLNEPSNNGKESTKHESQPNLESLEITEPRNTENKSEKLDITPMDEDVQIIEETIVSQMTDTDKCEKDLNEPSNNGRESTKLESEENIESLEITEPRNTEKSEKLDITPMDEDVQIIEESIVSQTDTDKCEKDLNEPSNNGKESTKHESEENIESLEITEPRNTENKSEKLDITPMDEDVQIIEESIVSQSDTHKICKKDLNEPSDNRKKSTKHETSELNTEKNSEQIDVSPIDDDVQIIEESTVSIKADTEKCKDDLNKFSSNEILVLPDNIGEELEKQNELKAYIVKEDVRTVAEQLHLTLEEAFFLTFALGCLRVRDQTCQYLNIREMWTLFNNAQSDFIESYVAYHYFRAKGWVVKSGLKFGGNFLLYKGGPPFYHASCIVIIENINKLQCASKKTNWEEMIALHRMGEASKKEILTCQILWPDDLKEINSPKILHSFQVNEILLRRWLPGQEKDDE